jgi:predicted metalloprotease with PDZ domain
MNSIRLRSSLLLLVLLTVVIATAQASVSPAIKVTVDATQAPLRVLHTHLVIPAAPGPLTLYYPKWIPGMHEPAGPIENVAGLKFVAGGKTIPWHRDPLDVFTFHVNVPAGASQLEVFFDYLEGGGPTGGSATDKLLVFNWNQALLYPAGTPASKLVFQPALRLPSGWKFGTSLATDSQLGSEIRFQPTTLDMLVDSPIMAGEYFRAIDVTPSGEAVHHEVDFVADNPESLAITPDTERSLRRLVEESGKLFGARHYRKYHFLVALTDRTAHFGIEHHESSENRLEESALTSPAGPRGLGSLLAHEFVHSWCGKFRRPADMSTPDFQTPMQTDLLWVYEGTTTFLGDLLAERSGFTKMEDYSQHLANTAAQMGPGTPGRRWRSLSDTAVAVPGMFRGGSFGGWRRGSDYYPEGDLLWFEVAMVIAGESGGKKSLEDYLHSFYGGLNNGAEVKPYSVGEVIDSLNKIQPYDWAKFFSERVDSTSPETPVGGIERSGWKLVWDHDPRPEEKRRDGDPMYSIGLSAGGDGTVYDTIYDGPAFRAGLIPGMKILGINGQLYRPGLMSEAIAAAKDNVKPIELLVTSEGHYKICTIDYHDGPKFPHLVRDENKPDSLTQILEPLTKEP